MTLYAISLKVTEIEVIDDGNNGQGAYHKLSFPHYSNDDYFLNQTLITGKTIKASSLMQRSLFSKKYIHTGSSIYRLSVERQSSSSIWYAWAVASLEIDPKNSLGDTVWYIETHAKGTNSPNVSKIKIWFTLKTTEMSFTGSSDLVAFADRDCQGAFTELRGGKLQPQGYKPHGYTEDIDSREELSQVTRYGVQELRQLGNDTMSCLAILGAEGYVWIYEHDFADPRFENGRSRRFGPFNGYSLTYINLHHEFLVTFPDRSLDNQVSAIEVATLLPSSVR